MASEAYQPSFAAGELAPSLRGRIDLDKFKVGAAELTNWLVYFHGGVITRGGTQFCGRTRAELLGRTRLLPFIVSADVAYVVELGDHFLRLWYQGALVTDGVVRTVTGISNANPAVVTSAAHGVTEGQEVYFPSVSGFTGLSGKNFLATGVTADTFSLKDLDENVIDGTGRGAFTAGTFDLIFDQLTPWGWQDLQTLKFAQSADVMTLTHKAYPIYSFSRTGPNSFQLTQSSQGVTSFAPTGLSAAGINTGAGSTANPLDPNYNYGYVVTALSSGTKEESISSNIANCVNDVLDGRKIYNRLSWTPPDAPVDTYYIYKWGPVHTGSNQGTVFGYIGSTDAPLYTDNQIIPDYSKTAPIRRDPFSPGQIASVRPDAASSPGGLYVSLIFTDPTGTGAAGFGVVSPTTGRVVSTVITDPGKNYSAPVVTDSSGGTYKTTLGQLGGTYPGVVAYYQQRRVYANTVNSPESLVFSSLGLYNNFNTTPTILDTDSLTYTLAGREVDEVKSMVSTANGLIVLTSGGAWLVSGGSPQAALTPSSIVAAPQASSGANDVRPLLIGHSVLYLQNRGNVVRDLSYNYYAQNYQGVDRSILSNHFFKGFKVLDWCWSEEPHRTVWAVRDDNKLLALTYVAEQEVYGWSRHETDGRFFSVCSVPEGEQNAVYFVVARTINGVERQFVERLSQRAPTSMLDAWCLDSALSYSGDPATVLSGLEHLEGRTVTVVADGVPAGTAVVSGGRITLALPASKVLAGLPYTCRLRTLPLSDPQVQAKRQSIPALTLRVLDTLGLKAGMDDESLVDLRSDSAFYVAPEPLFTGDLRSLVSQRFVTGATVLVIQDNPMPANILAIDPEVTVGDRR